MITVFTSTYNRNYCLNKVYESLLRQTEKNFEWLVIDDGSTDGTEDSVNEWMKKTKDFNIRFYRNESSGGLQRAINKAYTLALGEWMVKVDSDDYLLDDAIQKFNCWIENIKDNPMCLGVGGLYLQPSGELLCEPGNIPNFPEKDKYIDANFFERSKYNLCMDTIEVYRVSVRRNYEIPIWETEKSGPERVAFSNMARDGYFIRWFPEAVAVVNYQPNGLSAELGQKKSILWKKQFVSIIIQHINIILSRKEYTLRQSLCIILF